MGNAVWGGRNHQEVTWVNLGIMGPSTRYGHLKYLVRLTLTTQVFVVVVTDQVVVVTQVFGLPKG